MLCSVFSVTDLSNEVTWPAQKGSTQVDCLAVVFSIVFVFVFILILRATSVGGNNPPKVLYSGIQVGVAICIHVWES